MIDIDQLKADAERPYRLMPEEASQLILYAARLSIGQTIEPDFLDDLMVKGAFKIRDLDRACVALTDDNKRLREALANLLEVYAIPNARYCCDGQDCGCLGATTHDEAEYYARAALAEVTK